MTTNCVQVRLPKQERPQTIVRAPGLAMERLRANDREAGVEETTPISRSATREVAEREHQVDRRRINDDCERTIETIRRQGR